MKKLLLTVSIVALIVAIQSCQRRTVEERKADRIKFYDDVINDTFTLSDGHIYYRAKTYGSGTFIPIHSQYCKNNH